MVSEPEVELHVRGIHGGGFMHHEDGMGEHAGMAAHAAAAHAWTYFPAGDMASPVEASASARTARKATRTITNQDIDAENQKTGTVKYSGKTEKIQ